MNSNFKSIATTAGSLLAFATSAAIATPESGVEFSETANTVNIPSQSTATPTVLRSINIRCPANGWVVATANALFSFDSGASFPGTVAYSLTRFSTSFQSNHQHNVYGNYVNNFHTFPASMQRVDRCNSGQNVIYRFLATRGSNSANFTARQPSLIAVFHRDRL